MAIVGDSGMWETRSVPLIKTILIMTVPCACNFYIFGRMGVGVDFALKSAQLFCRTTI